LLQKREQTVRAMRAINPAHALLPALEVKARQLKLENAAREKFLETAANSLCDD